MGIARGFALGEPRPTLRLLPYQTKATPVIFKRTIATLALALAVPGCASTTATYSSAGDLTVTSTRFLTNSAASLARPDGTSISITSAVDQAGTAAAFRALGDVIGVLGKLVAAPVAAPVPASPAH